MPQRPTSSPLPIPRQDLPAREDMQECAASHCTTGDRSPTFSLVRWDGPKRRKTTTLFVGTDELLAFIAALGPEEVEDRAGGVLHPQEPAVMCISLPTGRVALVDAEDYQLVRAYSWHCQSSGYVRTDHPYAGALIQLHMHRLVMMIGPDDDEVMVDHINHDPLDNRRKNLRLCTNQQNSCNQRLSSANKSGIKGVYRSRGKWRATVSHLGVKYRKVFETIGEAEAWVRAKREQLHGDFACHG